MKIGYLILAHDNFHHLKRLVSALSHAHAEIFLHIDKKAAMPEWMDDFPNVTLVDRVPVWWAGFSTQVAINNLVSKALTVTCDYYILLSGADYPIKPLSFLESKLRNGWQYINIKKGFLDHKPESRIKYYYLDGFNRKHKRNPVTLFYYAIELALRYSKIFRKRNYPFRDIYHGSTWWALSYDCLSYISNYINDNPQYTKFYRSSFCPDESFMHTIIGNSEYVSQCKNNLTYTDWSSGRASPQIIDYNHVNEFLKRTSFVSSYGEYEPCFARKFTDQSGNLIDIIDADLRSTPSEPVKI